jgi:hypothetical protein
VRALDAQTGRTVWTSERLRKFTQAFTTLVEHDGFLLSAGCGKLMGFDLQSGATVLEDNLKGLNYDNCTLATYRDFTEYGSCTLIQAVEMKREAERRNRRN